MAWQYSGGLLAWPGRTGPGSGTAVRVSGSMAVRVSGSMAVRVAWPYGWHGRTVPVSGEAVRYMVHFWSI